MSGILGGLDPMAVVLVISGLLFIEECGLPMPFAPGDLVLMLGGIGIATQEVNPGRTTSGCWPGPLRLSRRVENVRL